MCRFATALLALLCAGCTTSVIVSKIDPNRPETRVGIPYSLMYSRYEIVITRQVVSCGDDIKLAVAVEVKAPVAALDPLNQFVIAPQDSAFKTSDLQIGYLATGAPATLNATVEDRTAQVTANIASIAVSVATIAFGAVAAEDVQKVKSKPACTKDVQTALKDATTQGNALEAATKIVDTRTRELKALTDKIIAMGSNVDEGTKVALSRAYDTLTLAVADQKAKKTQLGMTLEKITHTATDYWPRNGDQRAGLNEIPTSIVQRWLVAGLSKGYVKEAADTVKVAYRLRSVSGDGRDQEGTDAVIPSLGIPFRQPIFGRLSACRRDCDKGESIVEIDGDVLQLGYVGYFPCKSPPFSSIVCSYVVADNGRLKSMGATSKVATAEAFTGALKDVIDKAGQIKEIQSTAATKQLQAETALLKAQAERDAAAAALKETEDPLKGDKDATAALKARTDLLNAQRAEIEAEIALAAVRANRP